MAFGSILAVDSVSLDRWAGNRILASVSVLSVLDDLSSFGQTFVDYTLYRSRGLRFTREMSLCL